MPGRFKFKGATKYGKRHKPGEMNQTEAKYAAILEARKLAGEIQTWEFERYTFKLADDTRYTPDFAVLLADGSQEFIDSKGGGPIDPKSLVKVKCAAERFPQFLFVIEQKLSKKDAAAYGSEWKRTEF